MKPILDKVGVTILAEQRRKMLLRATLLGGVMAMRSLEVLWCKDFARKTPHSLRFDKRSNFKQQMQGFMFLKKG